MFQNFNVCQDCGQPLTETVPYGDTVASAPIDCDCHPEGYEYECYTSTADIALSSNGGETDTVPVYVFVNVETGETAFFAETDWQNEPEVEALLGDLCVVFPEYTSTLDKAFGGLLGISYETAINAIN